MLIRGRNLFVGLGSEEPLKQIKLQVPRFSILNNRFSGTWRHKFYRHAEQVIGNWRTSGSMVFSLSFLTV
jgi:hypothetical protein